MVSGWVFPACLGAQQKVDVRRGATPDISVRISGTFASLRIVGTTTDSLVVTGSLPPNSHLQTFAGGKGMDPILAAKIFVDAPNDQAPAAGTLEMRVPARARVWVKAGTASLDATGVSGGLDLNIVGGSVRVAASPRELNVESMDGGVTIEGDPEWLRVKTAAGDIGYRGSSQDAGFTTVSGAIRAGPGRFDRARFESVTGPIEFTGDGVRGASLTFDSHSGTIVMRLDPALGIDIDATSIAGTITNGITNKRPTPGRDQRGQILTLTLGQGEAHATIRTFKGAIQLLKK
jgi:hypothetical protein